MKSLLTFALLYSAAFLVSVTYADTRAASYENVLSRALDLSPLARQVRSKHRADLAEAESLTVLENPVLDAELRSPTTRTPGNEISVSLGQSLRAGDFGMRARVNTLLAQAATLEQRSALLELTQSLRLQYVKVWSIEHALAQLKAAFERTQEIEVRIRQGSDKGLYGKGEAMFFRAEALKLKNQQISYQAQLKHEYAMLSQQAGFSIDRIGEAPALELPTQLAPPQNSESTWPSQERAALGTRLAEAQRALAAGEANPKIAPRLLYERDSEHNDFFGLGLSIALPVFDRNQAMQKRRTAELETAQALQSRYQGARFQQQVLTQAEAARTAIQITLSYENEIVPALSEALSTQEELLKRGQGSVFQVWQTLRELWSTQEQALQQRLQAEQLRSEYVVLIGEES